MSLSSTAQAILLLTVPLGGKQLKPLTTKEWSRLASYLKAKNLTPADLINTNTQELLSNWMDKTVTGERISSLLEQGGALGLALEKWERAGLWVLTRSDPDYPEKLKQKLRHDCPPILFGCGRSSLLRNGGIAVVGSRNADEAGLGFCEKLSRAAAEQGQTIVSGGARGVDECAMLAALKHEGTSIGVLAENLMRASSSAKWRTHLLAGDLVLITPFHPEARFQVWNAMSRNKFIYCMSDAAVVVNSVFGKGGTWSGAIENIQNGWVPQWVREDGNPKSGNSALIKKGAQGLSEDLPALETLFSPSNKKVHMSDEAPMMSSLFDALEVQGGRSTKAESVSAARTEVVSSSENPVPTESISNATSKSSDKAPDFYSQFLAWLAAKTKRTALKPDEICEELQLEKSQINAWLKQAVADDEVSKLTRPVRYQVVSHS